MNKNHLNILLCDDDTDDCLFFEKALEGLDRSTKLNAVYDGEQLIDYLSKHIDDLPDVLFLDLNMPRKNGFESLCEIKEDNSLKDLQIIMFSTSFPRDPDYEEDMKNRLLAIGADYFIRKPEDFELLKKTIDQALEIVLKRKLKSGKEV